MSRYCTKCGAVNDDTAQYCTNCQAPLTPVVSTGYEPMQGVNQNAMTDWKAMGADKKIVAGICAILLGWLGVHKFILGCTMLCLRSLGEFLSSIGGLCLENGFSTEPLRRYRHLQPNRIRARELTAAPNGGVLICISSLCNSVFSVSLW